MKSINGKYFDSITELENASTHKLIITSNHSLSQVAAEEVAIHRFSGIYLNACIKKSLRYYNTSAFVIK